MLWIPCYTSISSTPRNHDLPHPLRIPYLYLLRIFGSLVRSKLYTLALPELRSNKDPESPAKIEFCTGQNYVCMRWYIHVHGKECSCIQRSKTLELDRQYYDLTDAYVIAQQYSYCTLKYNSLSLAQGNIWRACQKLYYCNFFYLFLKFRNAENC
jgi:hypothetical protein